MRWNIEKLPDSGSLRRIVDENKGAVTTACHCSDAPLIAKAPELRDMLIKLVDICSESVEFADWPELRKAVDKAEKIVEKTQIEG